MKQTPASAQRDITLMTGHGAGSASSDGDADGASESEGGNPQQQKRTGSRAAHSRQELRLCLRHQSLGEADHRPPSRPQRSRYGFCNSAHMCLRLLADSFRCFHEP